MNQTNQRIREIFEQGYLMTLATGDEGSVWANEVIYVFDDALNVYWISDPNVRHSQSILRHPQVAGVITVSRPGEDNFGIQFSGTAEKIEGPRFDLAVKHYLKRKKSAPREDQDILEGDSWYRLRPTFIELIDEKHHGFEKQKIML